MEQSATPPPIILHGCVIPAVFLHRIHRPVVYDVRADQQVLGESQCHVINGSKSSFLRNITWASSAGSRKTWQ